MSNPECERCGGVVNPQRVLVLESKLQEAINAFKELADMAEFSTDYVKIYNRCYQALDGIQ